MSVMRSDTRIRCSANRKQASACPAARFAGHAVFSEPVWKGLARSLGLSPRELEIVRGLFDGEKQSGIAVNLGLAPCTVHTHVRRLHAKFAVRNRVELMVRIFADFLALTGSPGSRLPPVCPHHTAGRCPLR